MGQSSTALLTAEEFAERPYDHAELIRGRVVVHEPPADRHGAIAGRLTYLLGAFVYPRTLGVVYGETGFQIESDPDTVRAPDVAFLSRTRDVTHPVRGFGAFAPDLCVEILSPGDRVGAVMEKIAQWLNAGASLVWVIDADRRRGQIFRADGSIEVVGDQGSLSGEDVLPGFTVALADVVDTGF